MVELHDDATVNQLVDYKDDPGHVVDQTFALDVVFLKNRLKAKVNGVYHRCQDQLVVMLRISDDVDGHVRIAPEDRHVILNIQDVVLKRVGISLSTLLLVALLEESLLKLLLEVDVLEAFDLLCVVVLGDDPSSLVVEHDHGDDVADHVSL